MGDYRYKADTTDDSTGIIRTADEADIPVNTNLGAWNDYIAWRAVPNTPDPFTALSVASERTIQKSKIEHDAEIEYQKDYLSLSSTSTLNAASIVKAIQEAEEIVRDAMAFAAARHPMINEMIPDEGANGAAVAAAISAWWDTKKVRIAKIHAAHRKAFKAIDAAGTVAAVRALYPVTWPA